MFLGLALVVVVERELFGGRGAENDLLDLGRKLGGDDGLGAAQDVGRGLLAQTFVLPVAIRRGDAGAARGGEFGVHVAGQHDLEKRAQILEGVFHGGAGEEQAALRVQGAEGAGVEGAAVFGVLGLVGDEGGEVDVGEELGVAAERAVRGDE